jgi:MFS family permease
MSTGVRTSSLWRHADFMKLWAGQTVSLLGSQVTFLGLPLVAALTLQATPAQMSYLSAASTAAPLLLGMFAGVWIDRRRRRSIMIAADLARALLIGLIPLGALLGFLRLEMLIAVGFLSGAFSFLFDTSYRAYLPSLVSRHQLVQANGRLEASYSLANIAGPGLAGVLVEWLTAPFALLVDAFSYLVSALSLGAIRTMEPAPISTGYRMKIWQEIKDGLNVILRSPVLKPIAISSLTLNFAGGFYAALLVLYITRVLGLDALFLGSMYAVGSLSGLGSAILGKRIMLRFGLGWTIIGSAILIGFGWSFIPASGSVTVPQVVIIVGMLFAGFGNTTYNIHITSLAQSIVRPHLLGRYNATMNFFALGLLPLGSLIAGALGTFFGVRTGLFVGAGIMSTAFLWTLFSPLRKLVQIPE